MDPYLPPISHSVMLYAITMWLVQDSFVTAVMILSKDSIGEGATYEIQCT